MKQYTVQITDKALADMEDIYTCVVKQLCTPENAIEELNIFPERVCVMEFDNDRQFFAFYVIEDDKVIVTRVLYSASDISRRLMEK